jgi:hypothetical protein
LAGENGSNGGDQRDALADRFDRGVPAFLTHAARVLMQARRAPGLLDIRILADRRRTFWTATAWEDLDAMGTLP